jgi:hypothetical protein
MKGRPSSARPAARLQHFDLSSDAKNMQHHSSIQEHSPSSAPLKPAPLPSVPCGPGLEGAPVDTNSPLQSITLVTGHPITASARPRPRPQSAKGSTHPHSIVLSPISRLNFTVQSCPRPRSTTLSSSLVPPVLFVCRVQCLYTVCLYTVCRPARHAGGCAPCGLNLRAISRQKIE